MPFAATWVELETLILSEVSQKEKDTVYHLHVESKIWHIWSIYKTEKIMDMENRLVVAKGEREAVGWTGSLGLVDAKYHI